MNEKGLNNSNPFNLKAHGFIGILLLLFAESAFFFQNRSIIAWNISIWTTPICWWGYIMIMDSLIFYMKKESIMVNHKGEFMKMLILSNIFWIIFEVYNLSLRNWKYIGLPRNLFIATFGMAISFATILPGIFFTAEILETLGIFRNIKIPKLKISKRSIYFSIIIGLVFLILPLLLPHKTAKYLFAFVLMGFFFLLEPLNFTSRGESFLKDIEKGELNRILSYFFAGLICGILCEFWNFWAVTKWIYILPFSSGVKIFEMPLAGFLGFGPFAWELFSMYHFSRLLSFKKNNFP